MTEKSKGKKLLTWTLALSMTLALPPIGVFAEEGVGGEGSQQTNTAPATKQPDGSSNGSEASNNEGTKPVGTPENGGQNTQTAPPSETTGTSTPSGEEQNGKGETLTPTVGGGGSEKGEGESNPAPIKGEGEKGEGEGEKPSEEKYAAKIGEEKYETLKEAMKAAKPRDTIVLQKDITITEQKDSIEVKVSNGFKGELTIDLNNHFIDGSDSYKCIWRTGNTNCWPSKLIVKNGTLKNGNPSAGSKGGAIQWVGDLEVDNCTFENNKGCAIQASSGEVNISNSIFTGNEADRSGGAIQITENKGCIIHNCTFSDNTVTGNFMGGAVYIDHGETFITECSFTGNSAAYGGAIAVANATGINISGNTEFLNNTAANYGGAISIQNTTITIGENTTNSDSNEEEPITNNNGASICNNKASVGGGGIYGLNSNIILAEDNALYNNDAQKAGDDLFTFGTNGTNSMISLADATKMSGDRKLASDGEKITGWFYDGYKDGWCSRWGDGSKYYDEYTPIAGETTSMALKAAHEQLYKVTVHYVYSDGTKAAEDAVINVKAGTDYSIDSPAIEGYKADKATVSGTISAETSADTEITVTYTKESSGGGGGGGGHRPKPKPTVEIPDDDALGLNNTDHFAYIVGYGNGEVQPQNSITRAEVAAIFFRLLEDGIRNENFTHQNDFSDVAADAWYCSSVSTLSRMGIIAGYPDGTFRPNAPITRAEFAAIATRFDNNGDKTPVSFTDIIGHWAEGEITVAANHGWVSGYGDNTFRPQNQITRAETMSLVNRVLKRLPETSADLLPDMITWTDNADTSSWYYLPVQEATNSHYYEFKENSKYEKWTELRETRDWSKLG
ncbi:S-layer homology domain-containing protein [Anaerotignum faecicola]